MIAAPQLLVMLFATQLEISAPPVGCPDAHTVRKALRALNVKTGKIAGRMTWTRSTDRVGMRLTTETGTVTKQFPLASCQELADSMALVVERAVAPMWGEMTTKTKRKSLLPDIPPSKKLRRQFKRRTPLFELTFNMAGALLLSSEASGGVELGLTFYPLGGSFGVGIAGGSFFPVSYEQSGVALSVMEVFASAGLLGRFDLLQEVRFGFSAMGTWVLVTAEASGLEGQRTVTDHRYGARTGVWIERPIGPVDVGIAGNLRFLNGDRAYTAKPRVLLANRPFLEVQFLMFIGYTLSV